MTAAEHLQRHGLSWAQLEALARKALHDAMRECGSSLDEERRDAAAFYLLEVGLAWAERFDPSLANGVSFATSAFRRMKLRYEQFLRDAPRFGFAGTCDVRRGSPLLVTVLGEVPERAGADELDLGFEDAIRGLLAELPADADPALVVAMETVARPMAEEDLSIWEAADRAGVDVFTANAMLGQLAAALRGEPVPPLPVQRGSSLLPVGMVA